jgi:hypothetical protein
MRNQEREVCRFIRNAPAHKQAGAFGFKTCRPFTAPSWRKSVEESPAWRCGFNLLCRHHNAAFNVKR